ncbi:MAG: hypothetical protein ACI9G1_002319, partial [Pirellulaceae bacterium]
TPNALVADVHALLTLTCRFHNRSVHFNRRLFEKRVVLLTPNLGFIQVFLRSTHGCSPFSNVPVPFLVTVPLVVIIRVR